MKLKNGLLSTLLMLIHVLYAVLFSTTGVMMVIQYIIAPRYDWMSIEETLTIENKGFYDPEEWCPPTTYDLEDLVVTEDMSRAEAKNQILRHGSGIVRNVFRPSTIKAIREFVMEENRRTGEENFVLEGDHRSKIRLSHRDAGPLMKEFASHPVIRPLVDDLLGPQASLISMDVITNRYGANRQEWHRDAPYSKLNYPAHFVNEYSFTISLQDTTTGMGATAICPGTHVCTSPRIKDDYLWTNTNIDDMLYSGDDIDGDDKHKESNEDKEISDEKHQESNDNDDTSDSTTKYFDVPVDVWQLWNSSAPAWDPKDLSVAAEGFEKLYNSTPQIQNYYDDFEIWMKEELPFCNLRAELNAGDLFVFDIDVWHKGEAHIDPNGEERALLFLTFAESRFNVSDKRFYPLGPPYIMNWDSYGHTIDDFMDTKHWHFWQSAFGNLGEYVRYYFSFGYFLPWFQPRRRLPWTMYDFMGAIWTLEDNVDDVLSDWLTAKYVKRKTHQLMDISKTTIAIYIQVLILVLFMAGQLPKATGLFLTGTIIFVTSLLFWSSNEFRSPEENNGDNDDNDNNSSNDDDNEKAGEDQQEGDHNDNIEEIYHIPMLYLATTLVWPLLIFPLIRRMKQHLAQQKVKLG